MAIVGVRQGEGVGHLRARSRALTGTGRASESKSLQTRARLVDAAADVLSRAGYAGFRLATVARQAEVRPPAIYYYYPSRDDLIEEVLWVGIAGTRRHVSQVLEALPADTSPLDRLMAAVEAHVAQALKMSSYTTAFLRNVYQVPPAIRHHAAQEEERYGLMWQDLFESASAALDPRVAADLATAQMFILGVLNWTAEWQAIRSAPAAESIEIARAFVLKALTSNAPTT